MKRMICDIQKIFKIQLNYYNNQIRSWLSSLSHSVSGVNSNGDRRSEWLWQVSIQ